MFVNTQYYLNMLKYNYSLNKTNLFILRKKMDLNALLMQ